MGKFLTFLLVILLPNCRLLAQCCIDTSLLIEDESSQSLKIKVSGIINNDLSNPNQGVCKVSLKFTHQYIGDLSIVLLSPAGEKVELIGPICNTAFTQNSLFDVSFIPCGKTPQPDIGFRQRWDNCQKWGSFSKRTGTYWPFKDCLEDFNVGTVNGTWTFLIKDEDRFYSGKLLSACIEFCDSEMENCEVCEAKGGYFDQTFLNLNFCKGDPRLNIIERVILPKEFENNSNYSNKYYIVENDRIIDFTNNINLIGKSPGVYNICNLSYLNSEELTLPKSGYAGSFLKFKEDLSNGKLGLCAEFSLNCLTVNILDHSLPTNLNISICSKDTFILGSVAYNKSGTYSANLRNQYGCDSLVTVNLSVLDLKANISPVADLNCQRNNVVIDASSSSVPSDASISWTTSDGNIADQSNILRIVVNKKGKYKLLIQNKNCIDSAEVEVMETEVIPELRIVSDTITCHKPEILVQAFTNIVNATWEWKDIVSTIIGRSDTQRINRAGLYSVNVKNSTGCSNVINFRIYENKKPPEFDLFVSDITCKTDSSIINIFDRSQISSYEWSKGSGIISTDSVLIVRDTGFYTLTAKASNGCPTTKIALVISTVKKPEFRALYSDLNCKDTIIKLVSLLEDKYSLLEFYRFQPDSFYFAGLEPEIRIPGRYLVRLIDTGNCLLDTFVDIIQDTLIPEFRLSSKNLTCNDDSVKINFNHITDSSLFYKYRWYGPIGFSSDIKEPWLKEGGTYFVEVTGPNGCIKLDSIVIFEDISRPRIDLFADTINCNKRISHVFSNVSNASKYEWQGPGLFTSGSDQFDTNLEGLYRLVVTASNGCTSEKSVEVIRDESLPFASIKSDTIDCNSPEIFLGADFKNTIDTIKWYWNGSFISDIKNPLATQPGYYRLYAKGRNGCSYTDSVYIHIDTARVPVEVYSLDTLSCILKVANLSPDPTIIGASYHWITPKNDTLKSIAINATDPGYYKLVVTEKNGCRTIIDYELQLRNKPPKIQFLFDTLTCSKNVARILPLTNEANLTYRWTKPDMTTSDSAAINANTPGFYFVKVVNSYGCELLDTIEIISLIKNLNIFLTDTFFNCKNKSSNFITFSSNDSLKDFYWTNSNNQIIRDKEIFNVDAGRYSFYAVDSNGCEYSNTFNIIYDTLAPSFKQFSIDTLNCKNKILGSKIVLKDSSVKVLWTGPGFNSFLLNPEFPRIGQYALHLEKNNFCVFDTLISIVIDTILPNFQLQLDSITCNNPIASLTAITNNNTEVLWINSVKDTLYGNSLMTSKADVFQVIIINKDNFCTQNSNVEVYDLRKAPNVNLKSFSFICVDDSLQLNADVDCSDINYVWSSETGLFKDTTANPFVTDTGLYRLKVTCNQTGCDTTLIFHIDRKLTIPNIFISIGSLSCKNDSTFIEVMTGVADTLFEWKGPNGFNSTQNKPVITTPGLYSIKVLNLLGCFKDTSVIIFIDTLSPKFNLVQVDTFRCDSNIVRISIIDHDESRPKIVSWNTVDGILLSADSIYALANKAGVYSLTMEDSINGCITEQFIRIVESTQQPLIRQLNVKDVSCQGFNDASIIIESVSGGKPRYYFSLNDSSFEDDSVFNNLSPGRYDVQVKDYFGCLYDTSIFINDQPVLSLDILQDTVISLGETVQLNALSNFTNIKSMIWIPTSHLSCTSCLNPIASPVQTITYELTLTDSNNCEVKDIVTIEVVTDVYVFVPNVFSPNGDGINDYLEITFSKGIKEVESFFVFDRWGSKVYESLDYVPGSSTQGWNGEFNGKPLNPGVYTYLIKCRTLSGKVIESFGDITLLR